MRQCRCCLVKCKICLRTFHTITIPVISTKCNRTHGEIPQTKSRFHVGFSLSSAAAIVISSASREICAKRDNGSSEISPLSVAVKMTRIIVAVKCAFNNARCGRRLLFRIIFATTYGAAVHFTNTAGIYFTRASVFHTRPRVFHRSRKAQARPA